MQIALMKWGVKTTNNTFAVGSNPSGICSDGRNIWVTNFSSNTLTLLDGFSGTFRAEKAVGNGPLGACYDGSSIWVANSTSNTVSQVNCFDLSVKTHAAGTGPNDICYDGAHIWTTNAGVITSRKSMPQTVPR
ncbi:MAG TPA: hypothetical protein VF585_10570 [Chthoniobacterales bacterium]|jgi:hypothetical protein